MTHSKIVLNADGIASLHVVQNKKNHGKVQRVCSVTAILLVFTEQ